MAEALETISKSGISDALRELLARPHWQLRPKSRRFADTFDDWIAENKVEVNPVRIDHIKDAGIWRQVNRLKVPDRLPILGFTASHQLIEAQYSGLDLHLSSERLKSVEGSRFALVALGDEKVDRLRRWADGDRNDQPRPVIESELPHVAACLLEAEGIPAYVEKCDRSMGELSNLFPDSQGSVVIAQTKTTINNVTLNGEKLEIVRDDLAKNDPSGIGQIMLTAVWNEHHPWDN